MFFFRSLCNLSSISYTSIANRHHRFIDIVRIYQSIVHFGYLLENNDSKLWLQSTEIAKINFEREIKSKTNTHKHSKQQKKSIKIGQRVKANEPYLYHTHSVCVQSSRIQRVQFLKENLSDAIIVVVLLSLCVYGFVFPFYAPVVPPDYIALNVRGVCDVYTRLCSVIRSLSVCLARAQHNLYGTISMALSLWNKQQQQQQLCFCWCRFALFVISCVFFSLSVGLIRCARVATY